MENHHANISRAKLDFLFFWFFFVLFSVGHAPLRRRTATPLVELLIGKENQVKAGGLKQDLITASGNLGANLRLQRGQPSEISCHLLFVFFPSHSRYEQQHSTQAKETEIRIALFATRGSSQESDPNRRDLLNLLASGQDGADAAR